MPEITRPITIDVNWLITGIEELIRRTVGPCVLLEVVCDRHRQEDALVVQ
jgi:hypothetical protein